MSDRSPVAGELAALRSPADGLLERTRSCGLCWPIGAPGSRAPQQAAGNDAAIAALAAQMEELTRQVADLAARVTQSAKNSSWLPSADGLGEPTPKSLRKKPGRSKDTRARHDGTHRSP